VDAGPPAGWEALPLEEQRTRWVALQVDQACEGTRLAVRLGRSPTSEEGTRVWEEVCARHGFGRIGCACFIKRFLADPELRPAMNQAIARCVREAQGIDDRGRLLPRDAAAAPETGATPR
jgi:hypothetical protein